MFERWSGEVLAVNGVGETNQGVMVELLSLSARGGRVCGSGAISPEMVAGGGADEGGCGSRGV
jgi:hypothetical protein